LNAHFRLRAIATQYVFYREGFGRSLRRGRKVVSSIMHKLKPKEKREASRYPLERLAKIQFGINTPPCYCLISDISDGGVRLRLNGLEVPDEFVLLLSGDGPAQDGRYRVVWRHGDEIGAKYVS
jgi:hypothetical protein